MSFHAHTSWSYIAVKKPAAVCSGTLSGFDVFIGQIFQKQCVRIFQEAGHGRVARDLIVQEHAPVVAVRHGQFTVGKRKLTEYIVHNFLVVVHEGIGLPFGVFSLEQFECQIGFAQLLYDYILI